MKQGKAHFTNSIGPVLQNDWDIRGTGNFVFGGTGTGFLFAMAVTSFVGVSPQWMTLLALAFVGFGLLCVLAKIGRPLRAMNVIFNPKTSWMSREALAAGPVFLLGLAAVVFSGPATAVIAAVAGMIFLYCQGMILVASKGIPAWRSPKVLPLIISTGLVEGVGLLMLVAPLFVGFEAVATAQPIILGLALITIAGRVVTWRLYRKNLQETGAPQKALAALADAEALVTMAGHVAPVALLGLVAYLPETAIWALPIAGLLAALAGWYLKFVIINKAAFNQGFAIPHTPARGGGKAGPGEKPGW